LSPGTGGNTSAEFPRRNGNNNAQTMPRVSLAYVPSYEVAQQIFMARDDTVFDKNPSDPDGPAVTKWELDTNGKPARHQFEGNFSWLTTLTPAYPAAVNLQARPAEYHLSIVIFYKRVLNSLLNDKNVLVERPVALSTAPADLAGFGLGGGELMLTGTELDTTVRSGNWVMVSGNFVDPATNRIGPAYFRWYRVATVGAYDTSTSPAKRPITLAGPDWIADSSTTICKPTFVAVFENCVGVFEKTVHLEGPSVWGY
jgi:hypothetical protein